MPLPLPGPEAAHWERPLQRHKPRLVQPDPTLSAVLGDVADLKQPGRRRGYAGRGLREYCRYRPTVLPANPPIHRNDAQLSPEQPQHRPQE